MISSSELLLNFVGLATKSSKIAQILRQERSLFETLIEEKSTNKFLEVDYKTFGDVLIQEMVRFNLKQKFDNFGNNLYGEESNKFTNQNGEIVSISFTDDFKNTEKIMESVLENRPNLISNLVKLIHSDIIDFISVENKEELMFLFQNNSDVLNLENVEIWIDPIDGTKQYMKGSGISLDDEYSDESSLYNVTVLIGVYDKNGGFPILGVVCQPFYKRSKETGFVEWQQRLYWGYTNNSVHIHSNNIQMNDKVREPKTNENGLLCISTIENDKIKCQLEKANLIYSDCRQWQLFELPGAGFKFVQLLSNQKHCYLVTEASTYKWDICAPHAVLKACGGGIIDFKSTINQLKSDSSILSNKIIPESYGLKLLDENQIKYSSNKHQACNENGFLGYVNPKLALEILQIFLL